MNNKQNIMRFDIKPFILIASFVANCILDSNAQELRPVKFSQIHIDGELKARTNRNFDRLETDIYRPEKVFPADGAVPTAGWPGDYEGRVLMGLILESQATHRQARYLPQMMEMLSDRLNSKGYFGPLQKEIISEQSLSGNSWLLRTLCEYYSWNKDPQTRVKVKAMIKTIIDNMVLPTKGYHKIYPIDPTARKTGHAVSGEAISVVGKWELSSDIGTDFVFMDGAVQAYELLPSAELKAVIEEIIARYLQVDLRGIQAQAHASLTGMRGVLRYYAITKKPELLKEVIKRYALYRSIAMTANYENFNWFDRPEWTEPCAIVDSYLLAVQLWQYTGKPAYLEDAHHIYYNALSNTQKANGGFSLSTCPRGGHNQLKVEVEEAIWCCTMRGAEGLTRAVQYSYFTGRNKLVVPFYHSSEAVLEIDGRQLNLKQVSDYPFEGKVEFNVSASSLKKPVLLKLAAPSWTEKHQLQVNNKLVPFKIVNGFLNFIAPLKKGDRLVLTFEQKTRVLPMANKAYSKAGSYTLNYGALMLGYETTKSPEITFNKAPELIKSADAQWLVKGTSIHLSPVYHLMDPKVSKESGYAKQVLFNIGSTR